MQIKLLCKNGGHEVDANPRLKGNQLYCGDPECQRARKRAWQKNKMATDRKYRRKQIAGLVRWRKEHALHRYQKQYRLDHPEYVEKNREKQRLRNCNFQHSFTKTSRQLLTLIFHKIFPTLFSGVLL
jgi:hypothetical protein